MNYYSRSLFYFKKHINKIIIALLCSGITAICSSSPVIFIEKLIDNALESKEKLIGISIFIISAFIIKGISYYLQTFFMNLAGQNIIFDLRKEAYDHIIGLPTSYFEDNKTGQIMSKITNDVTIIEAMIRQCTLIFTDGIMVSFLIGWIFYKDWKLSLFALIVFPIIAFVVSKFSKNFRKVGHAIQEKLGDISSVIEESIAGIKVIKSFSNETFEKERFNKLSNENLKINMKNVKLNAMLLPIVENINVLGLASILFTGGLIVISGELTKGELISFVSAFGMMLTPINRLTKVNANINISMGAAKRIFDLIDEPIVINEPETPIETTKINGKVEFNDISFSYSNGKEILSNINFSTEPGKVIAIVGSSGAGKTTFVNLIPRFYDITSGNIKIDDIDIRNLKVSTLRRNIGIVHQETFLFSGTVEYNISYGNKKINREKIIEAAKIANAHNFIMELENKYETETGQKGVKLSGGQRQRIAIARAVLSDPKILILDEATSALDTESEKLVQEALDRIMKNRTTFVIAHRLSTIQNADIIIVLDKGKIKEVGKHSELMNKNGIYTQLHKLQFS